MLDTGGDVAVELRQSLYRCVDGIMPGQMLLVISHAERAQAAILDWCRLTGNVPVDSERRNGDFLFWIRKS